MSKSSKFCTFWAIQFGSNFASKWSKYVSNNVRRDFRLPVSAFATVARKVFNGKFTAKIHVPISTFMLSYLTSTLKVWSLSEHYLISIWTLSWWNLNKIVCTKYTKFWVFCQKMFYHFENVLTPFWRIFHCSKNYGIPT